jgi:hypothetical protein
MAHTHTNPLTHSLTHSFTSAHAQGKKDKFATDDVKYLFSQVRRMHVCVRACVRACVRECVCVCVCVCVHRRRTCTKRYLTRGASQQPALMLCVFVCVCARAQQPAI